MECERCFGNDFYFDSEGKRQNCDHSFDEPLLRNVALAMAQAIINGSRRDKYGDNSLPMVASLWSLYHDRDVDAPEVAINMALLKFGRLKNCPYDKDTIIDLIGYLALYYEMISLAMRCHD